MRLLILAAMTGLLLSCNNRDKGPDVSSIKVNLSIERFENSFFNIDTNRMSEGINSLVKQYPTFFPLFTGVILNVPNVPPAAFASGEAARNEFLQMVMRRTIGSYRPLYDSIRDRYRDMSWLQKELTTGFQHVKYYYPHYAIPRVITFIGPFDAPGISLAPGFIAIGLQQFAGKNFSAYKDPEISQLYPDYISRRFDKEYMAPNCMKVVVEDLYPDTSQNAGLIDRMIEKGKQWWLLDHFMPGAPDSVKTGYTEKQLRWCRANEGNIWGSILSNTPDLYTLDQERIQNYLGEAPFTQDMETSNSSPGNIGQWVGWQIVKKFAETHPKLSVQEVLHTAARKIFQEAKYKPK